jgi:hypothetical protein
MKRVSGLLSVVFLAFAMAETSPEPAAMLLFGGVVCLTGYNNKSRNKSKKIQPHNQTYQLQRQALSGFLFFLLILTSWPT